jgi:hypothetical protein
MKIVKRTRRRHPRAIHIDGDFAYVPLSRGYTAVIDAADALLVQPYTWSAHVDKREDGSIAAVYAQARLRQDDGTLRIVRLHRFILDAPKAALVDHENGDGLLNTRANLRLCSTAQNSRNQQLRTDNTSGFKGVTLCKKTGLWISAIVIDRQYKNLGKYKTKEEAAAAYDLAAAKYHGEFARTNQSFSCIIPTHTMHARSPHGRQDRTISRHHS